MSAIIPVFIPHLGCPHACVFCDQRAVAGTARVPDASEVRRLIEEGLEKSGPAPEVAFYGGSFTAIGRELMEELLAAAYPFVQDGRVRALRCSTRPDAVDNAVLACLARFGVRTVELGAQSMSDDVLALAGRGHTARDTVRASALIKKAGLCLGLQVMPGLPGDTREGSIETARRTAALAPDFVRIYPVVVLRNTPLFDMWQSGAYRPLTVEEGAARAADMLEIYDAASIPVIRIGLNPTDGLSAGEAAAGAYHPALGELARSQVYFRRACAALDEARSEDGTVLLVHPSCVSVMVGQHRANVKKLSDRYGRTFRVRGDAAVRRGEVRVGEICFKQMEKCYVYDQRRLEHNGAGV